MDIEYVEDGVDYIKAVKDAKAVLVNVGGFNRWEVTRPDGSKYLLRPLSSKPKDEEPKDEEK